MKFAEHIGVNAGQGQEPYLTNLLKLGFRRIGLNADWALLSPEKGVYKYDWLRTAIDTVRSYDGNVLLRIFSLPRWLDPSQPPIPRWEHEAIARMDDWMVDEWRAHCAWLMAKFDDRHLLGLITETNLSKYWQRKAKDYADMVVTPAAEVFDGKRTLIVGSPTLQGENNNTFIRALKHFNVIRSRTFGAATHLDVHVYRLLAKDIIDDIDRFNAMAKPKHPVWITETGSNERECFTWWEKVKRFFSMAEPYTGEMKQEHNYKKLIAYLLTKPHYVYLYRGWDTSEQQADKDGLLRPDGTPKRAAVLLSEYLNGRL
jgi:putative glycosyl hydrolase